MRVQILVGAAVVTLLAASVSGCAAASNPGSATNTGSGSTGPAASGGASATGSVPDPCVLVTVADAKPIFPNANLEHPVDVKVHDFRQCTVATFDDSGVSYQVQVRHVDKATFEKDAKSTYGGAKSLGGLGDEAFDAPNFHQIFIWKGGTEVDVAATIAGQTDVLAPEVALGKIAVGRI